MDTKECDVDVEDVEGSVDMMICRGGGLLVMSVK